MKLQNKKNAERAEYWKQFGYNFDPISMTAYMMDQKVIAIKRSELWKQYGCSFDPEYMTAEMMDKKGTSIKRSEYYGGNLKDTISILFT